jgi:hypothetical protein
MSGIAWEHVCSTVRQWLGDDLTWAGGVGCFLRKSNKEKTNKVLFSRCYHDRVVYNKNKLKGAIRQQNKTVYLVPINSSPITRSSSKSIWPGTFNRAECFSKPSAKASITQSILVKLIEESIAFFKNTPLHNTHYMVLVITNQGSRSEKRIGKRRTREAHRLLSCGCVSRFAIDSWRDNRDNRRVVTATRSCIPLDERHGSNSNFDIWYHRLGIPPNKWNIHCCCFRSDHGGRHPRHSPDHSYRVSSFLFVSHGDCCVFSIYIDYISQSRARTSSIVFRERQAGVNLSLE